MKRIIAAALWVFSISSLASAIALFLGFSGLFGPILGISAGALVAVDPRHLIWGRTVPVSS